MSTEAGVTKADEGNALTESIPEPPPYNPQAHGIMTVRPSVMGRPTISLHINNSPGAQQTVTINGRRMGQVPEMYACPSCNQKIMTRVELRTTMKTHLFAVLLCAVGCIPCMCLPYCMKSCRDVDHYCPHCDAYIGTNKK